MKKIMIILGSSRAGRKGVNIGVWVKSVAEKLDDIEIDYADLKDVNLPFFNESFSPRFRSPNQEYSTIEAANWVKRVETADAFVIVTPEYNHGYPAVLKNALDTPGHEWDNKKVVLVGYSVSATGGVRALEQLIPVCFEIGLQPVGTEVLIGNLMQTFGSDYQIDQQKLKPLLSSSEEHLKKQLNLL